MIPITNIEFLETVFADLQDGAAALTTGFKGDPNDPPFGGWTARPWMHGEALHSCLNSNTNNYFAVSSFHPDDSGAYRRRKDQFARLHVVMVDDVGTKVDARKLALPLSAAIETSPANFQGLLFIAPTAHSDDGTLCSRLIDELVSKGLSAAVDPGMKSTTRLARLVVGVNGKQKYVQQLGGAFRVRLVQWNPERRYTVAEIARSFRLDLVSKQTRIHDLTKGEAKQRVESFNELVALINRCGLYQGESRGPWHAIVCPWVDTHTDRAATGSAICEPGPQNNWAGGFRCHHGHCERRTIGDVYRWADALARGAVA